MSDKSKGAWAFDLDGVLATRQHPFNPYTVGEPVLPILDLALEAVREGRKVYCFTARASSTDPGMHRAVREWLDRHGLEGVRITNTKTSDIAVYYDDRAVQVIPDTGELVEKVAAFMVRKTTMVEKHDDHCPHCDHKFTEKGYPRPDFEQAEREGIEPMDADQLCPACNGVVDSPELTDEQIESYQGFGGESMKPILLKQREKKRAIRAKRAADSPRNENIPQRGRTLVTYVPATALEAVDERVHTHTKTMPDNSVIDILKLIDLVKNREPQEILLDDLDAPRGKNKATGFSEKRYAAADTAYPLLVGPGNYLVDGRHRYFKLRDAGATKTKAHALTRDEIAAATLLQETKEATGDKLQRMWARKGWCPECGGKPTNYEFLKTHSNAECSACGNSFDVNAARQKKASDTKAFQKALDDSTVPSDMQFLVQDDHCIVNAGDWHEREEIDAALNVANQFFGEVTEENECGRYPGYKAFNATAKKKASTVPTRTGPQAILEALRRLDPDKLREHAMQQIKSGKITQRDRGVKMLNALEGLKRNNLKPEELMISRVPVLPPAFRPFAMLGNTYVPGDANELYQDLFKHRNLHKETLASLGERGAGETRLNMLNTVRALYGYGDPVSPKLKERAPAGYLGQILGTGPKHSFVIRKLLSKPLDNVGRSVITVDPDMDMNHVSIPRDMAWSSYGSMVQRRLVRSGMGHRDAIMAVKDRTRDADLALQQEMKERPLLISRAPAWHKFNYMGSYAKVHDGDHIAVNPYIMAGHGADVDGDTMTVHVPVLPDSVQEVKDKLMADKMLFSIKDPEHVVPQIKHEQTLGIWTASKRPPQKVHQFQTSQEALAAMGRGDVKLEDEIDIPDDQL